MHFSFNLLDNLIIIKKFFLKKKKKKEKETLTDSITSASIQNMPINFVTCSCTVGDTLGPGRIYPVRMKGPTRLTAEQTVGFAQGFC